MKRWDPDYRGISALILAIAIGLTFIIGMGAIAIWGRPIGETGGEALIALGGAVVGLLAGYIAGRAEQKERDRNVDDRPPDPE